MVFFDIPVRCKREKKIDTGFLRWLRTEKGVHRADPDHYIFSMLLRSYVVFTSISLIFITAYLSLSKILHESSFSSNLTLYESYISIINLILPISFIITIYFYFLYKKCVDKNKYSLLYNRRTKKRIGAGVFALLVIYPTIYELIFPSHALWLYETENRIEFWSQYHNDPSFLVIASFTVLLFYPLAAIFFFMSVAIADQEITKFLKDRKVNNND